MEVALSLTLLIGAGLLMRSFVALRQVHIWDCRRTTCSRRCWPCPRTATQRGAGATILPAAARASEGVAWSGGCGGIERDFRLYSGDQSKVEIAGKTHGEDWLTLFQHVSEEYFRVLRIGFRRGRPFSEAEIDDARNVAVVNETFVRRYLPGEEPDRAARCGSRGSGPLRVPGHDAWFEIVGVVADVINSRGLQVPIDPEVWMPYTIAGIGAGRPDGAYVAGPRDDRERGAAGSLGHGFGSGSGSAPARWRTLISEQLYTAPRFGFLVMTIFGCIGLILVTVGVYSVLAYSTTQKTHEIGVRMALGAERSAVLGMVVRAGLRLVVAGVAVGIGSESRTGAIDRRRNSRA